jgi:hypothetical protein
MGEHDNEEGENGNTGYLSVTPLGALKQNELEVGDLIIGT